VILTTINWLQNVTISTQLLTTTKSVIQNNMNKENAHLFLPLVQALIDGKQLQYKNGCKDNSYWEDFEETEEIGFYDDPEEYRIKPEPRTFEMWLTLNGHMYPAVPAVDWALQKDTWQRITVQEVLE
jgi:hypothetical protein